MLVRFACCDLVLQVALLVEEVLQLQMQSIHLLSRLSRRRFRIPRRELRFSYGAAELRDVGVENLLLLGDEDLGVGGVWCGEGGDVVEEGESVVAGLVGDVEEGFELGVGDDVAHGIHDWKDGQRPVSWLDGCRYGVYCESFCPLCFGLTMLVDKGAQGSTLVDSGGRSDKCYWSDTT